MSMDGLQSSNCAKFSISSRFQAKKEGDRVKSVIIWLKNLGKQ